MKKLKEWISHFPYKEYDPEGICVIKLSKHGLIEDWDGNIQQFLETQPEIGHYVHHIYPQFEGVFPFNKEQLSFPNIITRPDVYTNIDIFFHEGFVWMVFEDNSPHVFKFQDDIQKANEELLGSSGKYKIVPGHEVSYKEIYTELMYQLNVGVFQYDCDGYVTYSGKQPHWIYALKPDLHKANRIKISDSFPFLDYFIKEFERNCMQLAEVKLESDLWTEVDPDGKEKLLQCVGIKTYNTGWLLLVSHDTVLLRDRDILQKAREQQLFTEQLAKAKNELHKLLNFKDQFVSIVSHDIRSPISSVVSATDLMLADKTFKETISKFYLEFLESVNKDMKLLLDYNEKLYYWSNLQLGKFNIEKNAIDLRAHIASTRNRIIGAAAEKNISVLVDCQEDLKIEADESLFAQVLTNLANNALKFTPPGGTITLSAFKEPKHIVVGVEDTGIGIKPGLLGKLFSGYVKDHSDGTNGEKGSGLGLGICKRILDAHGFDIQVESEINKGTRFSIIIQ